MMSQVGALPPSIPSAVRAELSFDFTEYLAKIRRTSRETALSMLGEAVLDYQPDTEALRARRVELNAVLARALSDSAP